MDNDRTANTGPAGGRRPLVIPPDNSRMLRDIKNSLSHVHKQQDHQARSTVNIGGGSPVGAGSTTNVIGKNPRGLGATRAELSKSTPNLFDKLSHNGEVVVNGVIGGGGHVKNTNAAVAPPSLSKRNPYRREDLQIIAKSLAEFHIEPNSDTDENYLQQIMQWNNEVMRSF